MSKKKQIKGKQRPRSQPQTRTVQVRLSVPIYSVIQKAASEKGISLSAWLSLSITNAIMANAKQAVEGAAKEKDQQGTPVTTIAEQVEKGRKILEQPTEAEERAMIRNDK